jgi:hypothetical protein
MLNPTIIFNKAYRRNQCGHCLCLLGLRDRCLNDRCDMYKAEEITARRKATNSFNETIRRIIAEEMNNEEI